MRALAGSFSLVSAFFMVCTARPASPSACSIFGLDVTCVNEYSLENSSNSVETNCGPLSDLKISGIPCLVNMDCNARIVSLYFWDTSSIDISMKREKKSITKRYACPLRLNKSVPRTCHGVSGTAEGIIGSLLGFRCSIHLRQ